MATWVKVFIIHRSGQAGSEVRGQQGGCRKVCVMLMRPRHGN